MQWVDVAGYPGAGKSTICDSFWGPHDMPIVNALPPRVWHDWLNEVTRLILLLESRNCPTLTAVIRMNNRSVRKIATVARSPHDGVYIQTALAQRGLGFGWRMVDLGIPLDELRPYFRLMPVSCGVAFATCCIEEAKRRNKKRETVQATAHENRSHMVELMAPAIPVAQEVLHDRGIEVLEVSTEQPIADSRCILSSYAAERAIELEPAGRYYQSSILSEPCWWR